MEQFPQADYLELHRHTLVGLLDGAEEVALFNTPSVVLRGKGKEMDVVQVEGADIAEYEPGTAAEGMAKSALLDLITFQSLVGMRLVVEEVVEGQATGQESRAPAPQEQSDDAQARAVLERIRATDAQYVSYEFINLETRERISISTARLLESGDSLLARQLSLRVSDELVEREFQLRQVGEVLEVQQNASPVEDEVLRAITEFFVGKHNDLEAVPTMVAMYAALKQDRPATGLDELYARYPDDADRAVIADFVARLQARVEAQQASVELQLAAPELALPSAEELEGYVELIAAVRG